MRISDWSSDVCSSDLEFNKQAILVAEGSYQHDLKHGNWKQYYETGELLIEETYDQGVLHGRYASYHMNGKLLSEGEYHHGKREGFFNIFDDKGRSDESRVGKEGVSKCKYRWVR